MIAGAFKDMYVKYAPRWFKSIHWDVEKIYFMYASKEHFLFIVMPLMIYFYATDEIHGAEWIALKRPKTKEELLEIKRDYFRTNPYFRDYEIDQYYNNRQPVYDLAIRRAKYPEYYGNRYDGHKRYSWG